MSEAATTTSSGKLRLTVLSPEVELISDRECAFVALPAHDGELGVLPKHAPLVSGLCFGELRIKLADGKTERFYISGGYVQIKGEHVYVLTQKALDAAKLDPAALQAELDAAKALPKGTPEELEARQRAIDEAKLKIKVQAKAAQ